MIGKCPECEEAIRIPEGGPDQKVRCPLCSAEYTLERVFESLPPQLEIIGTTATKLGIQLDTSAEDELQIAKAESIEPVSRPSRRQRAGRRKETSVFAEILKVIMGGVVAIPVGVLCVWWFAGRAPFGVAETVSKYVPFIVPEKLRTGDRIDDRSDRANDDESDTKAALPSISANRKSPNSTLEKAPQGGGVIGFSADKFLKLDEGASLNRNSGQGESTGLPKKENSKTKRNLDNQKLPSKKLPSKAQAKSADKPNKDSVNSNPLDANNTKAAEALKPADDKGQSINDQGINNQDIKEQDAKKLGAKELGDAKATAKK